MMIIIILAYSNICIKGTYKFSRTVKTYLINFRMKQKQNAFKLHALKYLNAIWKIVKWITQEHYKISALILSQWGLRYSFQITPLILTFVPPENNRKPMVFWWFQGE